MARIGYNCKCGFKGTADAEEKYLPYTFKCPKCKRIVEAKIIKTRGLKYDIKQFIKKLALLFNKEIIEKRKESDIWLKKLNIKTILDIGANEGQFAKKLSKKLPNAKIYSFEPIKSAFKILKSEMKNMKNFKAFNFALGEKNTKSIIHHHYTSATSSLLEVSSYWSKTFPHQSKSEKEEILIKKLDTIAKDLELENNILIKLDVQGYEDRVIKGGKKTLSKAKIIIIETDFIGSYKGQVLFDEIYKQLNNLGFRYKGSLNQFRDFEGSVMQEDSIFIKK